MNRHIPTLLCAAALIAFSACTSEVPPDEPSALRAEVEALEASFAEKPTEETALQLAEKCQLLAPMLPDSAAPEMLQKAAEALFYAKRYRSAADLLKGILQDYPDAPNAVQHALLLSSIYHSFLGDTLKATALQQCMARAFAGTPVADSLGAVLAGEASIPEKLKALGDALYDPKSQKLNFKNATAFIEISELYAALLPKDSLAPLLLIRAAEVARLMKRFDKALELYQRVLAHYPDHPDAADAMFMIAFTWDSDLAQYDSARVWYRRFLETWPESDFADDADFLLQNLGKSEEELLKLLEQKAQ